MKEVIDFKTGACKRLDPTIPSTDQQQVETGNYDLYNRVCQYSSGTSTASWHEILFLGHEPSIVFELDCTGIQAGNCNWGWITDCSWIFLGLDD